VALIKGKQVTPASVTSSGILTTAAQTVFGQKTFDSTAAQTTAVISHTNLVGTSRFYVVNASPEGAVTASIGSMAEDITSGNVWTKASGVGNTGWVQLSMLTTLLKAGLAAAPTTEGRLYWSTDSDDLYGATGSGKQRIGPNVFNNGVRVANPTIWQGQATVAITTGIWTFNYAAAGFVTAPRITAIVQNAGATTSTQPFATLTAAPTVTSCTGRVALARNATVGSSTMAFPPVGTYIVSVTAIGDTT
jgi:Gill-associated viral 3C-like peptidase